jgi:hypothetical protein
MKKKIFIKHKELFDKRYNIIGDFDLFIRLSRKIYFSSIQEPLSIYRKHNKSFSNQNYEVHIRELKFWFNNQVTFSKNSLSFLKEKILYMEIILNLLKNNYILSINKILKISSLKKKIKLIIFLLIPNFIFKKLKSVS